MGRAVAGIQRKQMHGSTADRSGMQQELSRNAAKTTGDTAGTQQDLSSALGGSTGGVFLNNSIEA